jgi:hypothetical protein
MVNKSRAEVFSEMVKFLEKQPGIKIVKTNKTTFKIAFLFNGKEQIAYLDTYKNGEKPYLNIYKYDRNLDVRTYYNKPLSTELSGKFRIHMVGIDSAKIKQSPMLPTKKLSLKEDLGYVFFGGRKIIFDKALEILNKEHGLKITSSNKKQYTIKFNYEKGNFELRIVGGGGPGEMEFLDIYSIINNKYPKHNMLLASKLHKILNDKLKMKLIDFLSQKIKQSPMLPTKKLSLKEFLEHQA